MKKLHFKLFKRLSCIVVFTTLFFSHVQAKGINDAIQLPDFKSGKTIWVIRAGVGFNGFTGSNIETTKLQWENNDWNGSFGKATGYEFTLGFNKSFGNHPLYWGMELGMASRGYTSSSSWEKSGSSAISGGTDYHGKFQDEEFARWCSDHNTEWNDSNFFVSDNIGILSNCCRLLSDTSKLSGFINSIGGTALSIGSCRVSTINLARIAYESKCKKEKYFKILKDRVELDCKVLWCLRHIIKRNIEKGLLPNYQDGALELDKQYCTVGILGLYEVIDMFGFVKTDELGNKSYTDEGIELAKEILQTINDIKDNFTTEFSYNLESIPGENCAGVLAQCDNLLFETNKYFIYSNQWVPLHEKCTIQEKCKLGSILDIACSGGTIAHIDVEGRFPNKDVAWKMLNYVASKDVMYFAFTTKINVCKHQHAFIGTEKCPQCGEPIADKFARVVGFYTPVSSYSKIRRQEFDARKWYNLNDNILG